MIKKSQSKSDLCSAYDVLQSTGSKKLSVAFAIGETAKRKLNHAVTLVVYGEAVEQIKVLPNQQVVL